MSTQGHESEAINVSGLKASLKKGGNIGIYNEAICSTAGGTAAKVTNTTPPSFTLTAGAKILVKFTYAISVENATLQVGSSTAKPIYYKGAALPADLVKAGTSLLLAYDGTNFNIIGDINTDTTYQVMGASGANHASGLVPDTPSIAGTTKYLREDGTWQEPAGQNYSAGSGIDITNGEISVDSTVIYTKTQVDGQFMVIVNSNSAPTSSTLTYTATDGTTKNFKVGDEIRVPDAEADNGYTFYKLYALTTESNVTTAVWDKLGAGGGTIVWPEFVTISLTQSGGSDSDLIGATVVVTDDDTSDTLLSTTWQGYNIIMQIAAGVDYTVTVGGVTRYATPNTQSYTALEGSSRVITFIYDETSMWVDLGLPSGTKWAKKNIDVLQYNGFTASEYQYECSFFSWGNIDGHNPIDSSTLSYSFTNDNYNASSGATLTGNIPLSQDAAYRNVGNYYRIPSLADFTELVNNCDFINSSGTIITGTDKRTTINGVVGVWLQSKTNGNRLFLPCSGGVRGSTTWSERAAVGHYRTIDYLSSTSCYRTLFYSGGVAINDTHAYRADGIPIRPVR